MHIRVGYELIYNCPQPTPMILMLHIHYSRASDIVIPEYLTTDPSVPITSYRDAFGNWCSRIVAPGGRIRLTSSAIIRDTAEPDVVVPSAQQHAVEYLPEETLVFLLGSRYCETDRLSRRLGSYSASRRRDGLAFRRSAIMSITTSPSAMRMRGPPRRPGRRSMRAQASAATTRTLPSHSAADEYSGTILHGIPWRYGYAAPIWRDGFCSVV